MTNTLPALRRELVDTARLAYEEKLFSGTSGNLSLWCGEEEIMLITPTSVRYEQMEPHQVAAMELDGTVLSGSCPPSSEWRLHAVLYQHRPDVGAVFHTHSPYATAFAATRQTIPAVLIEAHAFLGGDIRCAPYATPGSREVGLNALSALEGRGGCTLANHGVLAVGRDLSQAFLRAEYLEDLAKIYTFAAQIGTPVALSSL